MKVSFTLKRFATLALPATCFALVASTTACGDDDTTDGPLAGSGNLGGEGGTSGSGGKGGSGGTGGSAVEGGSDGGGTGGSSGSGGGGSGGTGAGGEGAAPTDGGTDGGGGDGPAPFHEAKVNGADGTLVPGVSDLRGITFASNGKIWAVGHIGANIAYPGGVDRRAAVVRFNADGTLDETFDGDGIWSTNLRTRQGVDDQITNDGDEACLGVKELPMSGDIVVQCNARDATGKGRDVVLLKLSPTGSLVSWGGGVNVRKVDFGWTEAQSAAFPGAPAAQPSDESWGIDLTPDGTKIVVFGHGPAKLGATAGDPAVQRVDNDRYVTRVNVSDGAFDATFNGGAVFTFNTAGTNGDGSRRGQVEADGSIISAGYTSISGRNNIFVARLTPTGAPDPTFTAGPLAIPGVFQANPFFTATDRGFAECYTAMRQSTGRYVTTGYGNVTGSTMGDDPADGVSDYGWEPTQSVDLVSFGLKQGTSGGVLDETFGVDGTLAIQSEGREGFTATEDRGRDLVVLPDDRVVMAGRLGTWPALFVVTKDGELDDAEGGLLAGPSGADTIPGVYLYKTLSGTPSHFFAVAMSKDGKRVAATTSNHVDGAVLAVLSME